MKFAREIPEFLSVERNAVTDNLILQNIFNSMSDSLIVLDSEGAVLYANRMTRDVLGISPEELQRRGPEQLFLSGEENLPVNDVLRETVATKSTKDYRELDYPHPDGTVKRLAVTSSYLLADGLHESSLIGFVVVFKDITEVYRLKRQERELVLEKERVAREKAKSLQKLAMGVAHEIRNPVVTIGGFARRMLRPQTDPQEFGGYARKICENAQRLEAIVQKVQDYCDLPEPNFRDHHIEHVLREAIVATHDLAVAKGILVEVRDSAPAHHILLDSSLMTKALELLIENSVQASQPGSKVSLEVYRTAESTILEVKDSGCGISSDDRPYIFDPFFSTLPDGSGMGLPIVERIVHEHLGRIEVDSQDGQGTIVRLILPDITPSLTTQSDDASR